MKTKLIYLGITMLGIMLLSCSKTSDPSADDNLIGTWKGTLVQPEFGELVTNITINNATLNSQTGNGSFKSGDLSVCDDTQFNCGPLACSFNLSLLSTNGNNFYEVDQILIESNSTCGDGIFEITVKDQNSLNVVWYEESFPDNRANGVLLRQ